MALSLLPRNQYSQFDPIHCLLAARVPVAHATGPRLGLTLWRILRPSNRVSLRIQSSEGSWKHNKAVGAVDETENKALVALRNGVLGSRLKRTFDLWWDYGVRRLGNVGTAGPLLRFRVAFLRRRSVSAADLRCRLACAQGAGFGGGRNPSERSMRCHSLLRRRGVWPSAAPRVHGHCLTKVRSISIGISLATLRIKNCGTCIPWSVNVVAIFARTLMLSDVNPNRFWSSTCSGVSLM